MKPEQNINKDTHEAILQAMLQTLRSLEDCTRISVAELYWLTYPKLAKYSKGKRHSYFKYPDGDVVDCIEFMNEIYNQFTDYVCKNGFVIDKSYWLYHKTGYPQYTTAIFRRVSNIINTFKNVKEEIIQTDRGNEYFKKTCIFSKTYLEEKQKYCRKQKEYLYSQPMTLFCIPPFSITDKIDISEGHTLIQVLKGRGIWRYGHWDYQGEEYEDDPDSWHYETEEEKIKKGSSRGYRSNTGCPKNAEPGFPWIQFENTCPFDLIIFLVQKNCTVKYLQ